MVKTIKYYPSFSSGNSKGWLIKNTMLPSGITSRFYAPDYPDQWRVPQTLLSAGHNLTTLDLRDKFGANDILVMGDSGGYQIASGAMKWNVNSREKIFNWLEANCDIGLNLDIPPRMTFKNKFNEALTQSIENFKWFEKHQTGKTEFLNVLQYRDDESTLYWYKNVRGLSFNGWSVGGAFNVTNAMYCVAILLQGKEFEKETNKYLHFLGLSSMRDFLTLSILQRELNKRFNNRVQVSTDSSSPNRSTIFGTYVMAPNWHKLSFTSTGIYKADVEKYKDVPLPCSINCCGCKDATFENIRPWKDEAYMIMTNHNLNIYKLTIDTINALVDSHDEMIKETIPSDSFTLYKSIIDIVSSETPLKTYEKYKPFYNKISSADSIITNDLKINEFFEF